MFCIKKVIIKQSCIEEGICDGGEKCPINDYYFGFEEEELKQGLLCSIQRVYSSFAVPSGENKKKLYCLPCTKKELENFKTDGELDETKENNNSLETLLNYLKEIDRATQIQIGNY